MSFGMRAGPSCPSGERKRESHQEQGLKFTGAVFPNKGEPMKMGSEGGVQKPSGYSS